MIEKQKTVSKNLKNNYLHNQISDKLRGGYYTPEKISEFLVRWAVPKKDADVLEPSCGDGQFIKSLVKMHGKNIKITGVELLKSEAHKASLFGNSNTNVIVSDAFKWFLESNNNFDAVVGNPPFIRYQNFPEESRQLAFKLMQNEGLKPSRLINSWMPFVVLATQALKIGGRIGMVLPAELLQVNYAKQLRRYLSIKYKSIAIITFKQLVFKNIQQEVILFMAERKDCVSSNISLLEFENLEDLSHKKLSIKKLQHKIVDIDHDNEKWTHFFLNQNELELVRRVEKSNQFIRLGQIANVNVGIVTGNNDFFILNRTKLKDLKLSSCTSPIISKSNQLKGISFKESDYSLISNLNEDVYVLDFKGALRSKLSTNMEKYVIKGEKEGVTLGYKCRIRLPLWWNLKSTWIPDAFLLRQIHDGPKMIVNETESTSTDTIHRVKLKSNRISAKKLSAIFYTSLTFAFAEIRGRSYGGGVLELEPSEAENLPIPVFTSNLVIPYKKLDNLVRQKKVLDALNLMDSIVLKSAGLDKSDILMLRNIWLKLRNRRLSRNSKKKN